MKTASKWLMAFSHGDELVFFRAGDINLLLSLDPELSVSWDDAFMTIHGKDYTTRLKAVKLTEWDVIDAVKAGLILNWVDHLCDRCDRHVDYGDNLYAIHDGYRLCEICYDDMIG